MKPFITDDFLLETDYARELYHRFSKQQPIFDYHCHLPPEQIAANHQFADLADVWLGGDHYKWRAMRINGIPERCCTGDASPREKFDAWVKTLPYTLRNPLYHWSHLEMVRYFGISEPITAKNSDEIWRKANEQLPKLRTHDILKKFDVAVVCTTDDPADDLASHEAIRKSGLATRVYPTFRPDKALNFNDASAFNQWRERLEQRVGFAINTLDDLLSALRKRHDAFHALGGRLSDHGLDRCWSEPAEHADAAPVFSALRAGGKVDREAGAKYCSFLMREFGRWDAAKGWTKQLHIGAQRNNNSRMRRELGPDTGYDGIGDFPQAEALVRYLDALDNTGELPRTIVYNANPADNYVIATAVGSFAEGGRPGKVQFGSGWWFLDQQEAMEWQMNALSNLGLLRRFVGMVTDSRSFLSYPRHEYFRRTLCNLLGKDIARGALPQDLDEVGAMVSEISYTNARDLFRMDLDAKYARS